MNFRGITSSVCLLSIVLLVGCFEQEQPNEQSQPANQTAPGAAQPSDQPAQPIDESPVRFAQRSPATSQPTRPTQSRPSSGPRNALIRGLLSLLGEAEDLDDSQRSELRDTLHEADDVLGRIKAENRLAIKNVNRQLRLEDCKSPNIVLIVADDLGYGDLGSYGQMQIQTPRLDRMAAEGIRFTNFYAGSAVGSASRCSLMTGLHTGHARIRGERVVPLQPKDVTIAEVLWLAGYSTGVTGKWGLGDAGTTGTPNRQGFEYHFGYLTREHAIDYYPEFLWENESQFPIEGNQNGQRGQYSHDLLTERALAFLDRSCKRPFFLYVPYTIPHANLDPPDDEPYGNETWPQPMKNYAAMITRMDRDVGRILDRLVELEIDHKTVVLFTSDNGPHDEGGGDPGFFESAGGLRGKKADLHEGGVRVPMIIRWGRRFGPGAVSDHVWAFWDLLPTLADLAYAWRRPHGIDGISIAPILLGGDAPTHDWLYWELHDGRFAQAMRTGQWKAVRGGPGQPLALYDLSTDPAETTDVAAAQGDVVEQIEQAMSEAHTDSPNWPVPGN